MAVAEYVSVYVYYRVRPEKTEALRASVVQLFAHLADGLSTPAELSVRLALTASLAQTPSTLATWMERYQLNDMSFDRFLAKMEQQVARLQIASCIDGHRTIEVFAPCA